VRDPRLPACVAALVLLAGCVVSEGVDASECRNAATAQAQAEVAWSATLDAHATAHEITEVHEHPNTEVQQMAARVDLIIAIEATRAACG